MSNPDYSQETCLGCVHYSPAWPEWARARVDNQLYQPCQAPLPERPSTDLEDEAFDEAMVAWDDQVEAISGAGPGYKCDRFQPTLECRAVRASEERNEALAGIQWELQVRREEYR